MSGVIQQMLANPSAFLPEGYRWSECMTVEKILTEGQLVLEGDVHRVSPCCNAKIGGVMTDMSIIGLCRGCGHVVSEFDAIQSVVRVAEKIQ